LKHGFLDKYSDLNSPLHRLSATAKAIVFLGLIVFCVTTPATAYLSFASYFGFLVVCVVVSRVPPVHVLRRSLVVVPFVAMAALSIPFMRGKVGGAGGGAGLHPGVLLFQGVALKSYVSIVSLVILSAITPFPALLGGFRKLGAPKIFLSLMSFTYRYLFLLVEEFERMVRARDARCYGGKWLWQTKVVGRMIGTYLVRSYERAERVHQAMASRGFDGGQTARTVEPMRGKDYPFVLLSLVFFLCARIFLARG